MNHGLTIKPKEHRCILNLYRNSYHGILARVILDIMEKVKLFMAEIGVNTSGKE